MPDISKVTLPDNTTYDLIGKIGRGLIRCETDSTSTATAFVVNAQGVTELYEGLTLAIKNTVIASASGCTINVNDLGAKSIWRSLDNTALSTQWALNSEYLFVYDATNDRWVIQQGYNTNDDVKAYTVYRQYTGYKSGEISVFAYTLIMQRPNGTWESIVTSSSTELNKTPNPHGFLLYDILYWSAATLAPNSTMGTNNLVDQVTSRVDMRYSFNIANSAAEGFQTYTPVYIVGTLGNDGLFYLDNPWWTQTLPSTEDGKLYIYIGNSYDRYRMPFIGKHPIYRYANGMIRQYIPDSGTVNGHTVATDVPSGAVFTDTKYTFANGTNGFTVTPSGGSAQTVTVTPSITNNVTGSGTSGKVPKFTGANTIGNGYSVDTTVTSGSANLVTSGAVYTAIDNLPEPMVFKGSLGTGGTITSLPINGTASIGDTYKVITAGTYASQTAKIGDTFICDSKTSSANTWVLIPSGDEPSGTVTSVTIKATSPIAIDSSSAITTSGTRTLSHANSGVTAGTYNSVTVNATGHVTAGSSITATGSGTTGISIADHTTSSITGVQSSTTTASKVTLGTAISLPNVTGATDVTVPTAASSATTVPIKNTSATSIPNVTSVGSASNWVFEDITVPKAASSATSIPNVTAVGSGSFTQGAFSGGSGSFTATVTNGVLSFSHTHTAATHGADSHVHTAPTLGTAISVTGVSGSTTASHVKSGGNGTAPTLGTAISIIGVQSTTTSVTGVSGSTTASKVTLGTDITIPNVTGVSDVTVPIKNTSSTTVVTSKTHSVTDNGHTHTLS